MSNTNKSKKQDKQPTLRPKLGGTPNPKKPFNPYWVYAIVLAILMGMWFFGQDTTVKEMKWSEFQEYVRDNRISSEVVNKNKETAKAIVREESIPQIFADDANRVVRTPFIRVKESR